MQPHQHKKQLGQHFLHDAGIIDRIVRAIDPQPGQHLVEIGPGEGAITRPLLARHGEMTVIEFDRDLITPLQALPGPGQRIEVVHADVLDVDLTALAGGRRIRLVGNLPYNISSPILFHALEHAEALVDMHFMLQKEVVDRMGATPGSKVYGRLSVMLQSACRVTPLFRVPPGAFRPPPQVDSAVVRLVPRASDSIGIADRARFAALVKAAFAQRRKTLRNALQGLCDETLLRRAGIDPGARAEAVGVERYVALANLSAAHPTSDARDLAGHPG